MTTLEITRLSPDDWSVYRELRIAALTKDAFAFGSTLGREKRLTEAEYRVRLVERAMYAAHVDGRAVGLIGGMWSDNRDVIELISMWVHPDERGKGLGDALVQEILTWAGDQGSPRVHLWVTEGNEPAERLYARNGFVRTGEEQVIRPEEPDRREVGMVCELPRP
jgi:GNAT superfamily N-acetyltransferase